MPMTFAAVVGTARPSAPADSAQAKAKLAAVRARISALTNRLGDELKQRDAESARLRSAELEVTAKRQGLESLRASEAEAEKHRTDLKARQAREAAALDAERADLAAQVRAAYMMGERDEIKLLLNQTNPASLSRTLEYYRYMARERSARIEAIGARVQALEQLVIDIDQESAHLAALEEATRREMAGLETARRQRADAVAVLSRRVATGNEELANLKREEQAVEALVADLSRVLEDYPVDSGRSFAAMRGRLPWPVAGRVASRYQEGPGGGPRLTGELLQTARGAKVRAPFFGRVVYADWLKGLGLLLIVAHSGGYMTLYGHAEVLYKAVGDTVAPGDVIAGMSDTPGPEPRLYFEIREGRRPVDPRQWLRPAP